MTPKVFAFLLLLGIAPVISAQVRVAIGDEAPDFELADAQGKRHRLSDYRGEKLVVLEFFRSGDW